MRRLLLLLGLLGCAPSPVPDGGADLLFLGEHILSMDAALPRPTAVAIGGERILWVGDRKDGERWRGPNTLVHELGDAALLPGFIDAHGHLSFLASTLDMANVASPPVGPVHTIAELQGEVRRHIDARGLAAGEWVVGIGYDDSLLREKRHPNRDDLDAVSGDHPIALIHVSGHLMTANSAALEHAGINAKTADPEGGHIRRRPGTSEPNGVLEEAASYPLRGVLEADPGTFADRIQRGLEIYASHGVTTVQDGAVSPEGIAALQALAEREALSLDVVAYAIASEPSSVPQDMAFGQYRNRLKVGGIKMVLDGSPQGKTAFLSEPYAVPPHGKDASYRGYPTLPSGTVDALIADFIGRGVPILAHANGDAAAEMLIAAVEKTGTQSDHRTVMIHAQTVRLDQLDRMARLGMIPSYFSAHTFYWGDWHRDSVLGPVRAAMISPTRSTAERAMTFTVHNDAPVVPPDMLRLLWATTNRLTRSAQVLGAAERLDTAEALRAVTTHAAYQYFEEASKGTLAAGKFADLVLLSKDPLSIPAADLLSVEVLATYSRGELVFERPN